MDLWGPSVTQSTSDANTSLATMTPDQMVIKDLNNQEDIASTMHLLNKSLGFCQQLVTTVYSLADYVPRSTNKEQNELWTNNLLPNLVTSLHQDVKARTVIIKCLSSVRDLAITIQKAGELVKLSRGSLDAVAVAQKTVPAALAVLEECIEEANNLQNSAVDLFRNQTADLLKIVGPKGADYVKEKAEIMSQLKQHYEDQEQLYKTLLHKKGEVERLSHLVHVTEQQAVGAAKALEETMKRTQEMESLNAEVEKALSVISPSVPQSTITTTDESRPRFWYRSPSTSTKTTYTMVENPNREAEKNYYESIIRSRMARIYEKETAEVAKQKVLTEIDVCLSEYKAKYLMAKGALQVCTKQYREKVKTIQDQIDKYIKKLEEIEESEKAITDEIGLQGGHLMECLIEVRTFAASIKESTSVYAPLVSLLTAIKSSVEGQIQLLSTATGANVFLAGSLLLNQVGYLSNYSSEGRKCVEASSKQYSALEYSSRPSAIQS